MKKEKVKKKIWEENRKTFSKKRKEKQKEKADKHLQTLQLFLIEKYRKKFKSKEKRKEK